VRQEMRNTTITAIIVMLGVLSAQAVTYTDSVGDDKWGNSSMDITQVEVTHDALDINFQITLGDGVAFAADDFARFGLGIDSVLGGATTADAWNDKIIMSSGMDYWSAGWTDAGSGTGLNTYDASIDGWPEWENGGDGSTWVEWTAPVLSGNDITFSISRAALGVTGATDSFDFDVYTFWNDGSAEDALGLSTTMPDNWQYDSVANVNTYVIPEPASIVMLLVSGGGLVAFRRNFS
jgi:hypothetical protein